MVFPGLKLTFQLQPSGCVIYIFLSVFFPGAVVGVSSYILPVVTSFESECEGLPVFCLFVFCASKGQLCDEVVSCPVSSYSFPLTE